MPMQSGDIPANAVEAESRASDALERDHADAESARLFMASLPAGLGVGYLALGIIAVCLHSLEVADGLGWWTALVAGALTACLVAYLQYRREAPSVESLRLWGRRFVWLATASGFTWGTAAFFFLPAPPAVEMLSVLGVTAIAIGGIGHLATHLPCYFGFLLASTLPFVVSFVRIGDTLHIGMGVGMAALVVTAAGFGLFMNRTIRHSIVLAFRNRRLAEALTERTREAEQANAAKSRFLAAASHDLRQPVHAIGLLLDVLRGQALDRGQAEIVERLVRSCDALGSLFDSLLGVSRIDAGGDTPRFGAVSVQTLFDVLRSEFEPVALEKGLQFRMRGGRAVLRSDAVLLQRTLGNLLSNAIRYTHSGGVLLACRRCGDEYAIEVWDTGIGIAPEHRDAIFEEFFQCGNAQRDRQQGLGLGLAIVRRLVTLLGHSLELRSVLGQGSLFRIRLPAWKGLLPDTAFPRPARVGESHLGGTSVLVVDDEIEVRTATVALLKQWQCDAKAFGSMAEVITAAADWASAPDIVVSDLRLPDGRTGLELVSWLREEFNREIPALLVSGDAHSTESRARLPAGAVLLPKPASAGTILETLVALRSLPARQRAHEAVT